MAEPILPSPRLHDPGPAAQQRPTSPQGSLSLKLTYERARKVTWPFNKLYRPIGELLDDGKITHRDLGWASAASKMDPQIQEAARTLLVHDWTVPYSVEAVAEQGPGPEVVYGSRYLRRMEVANLAAVFGFLGFAIGSLIYPTANIFNYMATHRSTWIEILVAAIIYVGGLWLVYMWALGFYRDYKSFAVGREGENAVVERAIAVLDGHWTVFRNWVLPGPRRDDIDVILVGPGGVWTLEVKTFKTPVRVRHSQVGWRTKLRSKAPRKRTPDEQAEDNAWRLRETLNARGVNISWVKAVVVFPDYGMVGFTPEKAEVWHSREIDERLSEVAATKALPDKERKEAIDLLKALNKST